MKKSTNRLVDKNRRRSVKKWQLAAGSAAAAAMYLGASPSADAAIVYVTTPLSIGLGGSLVNWDVDGDSTTDFRLETFGSSSLSINGGGVNGAFVNLVGATEDGIEGFDTTASQFDVGPALPAGYFFGLPNAAFRTMMVSGGTTLGPDALGWAAPTQYVGFKFGAVPNYGWASVTLDTTTATLSINEWAYEDTGREIHLGAVPEPAIGGLALLACGAAGLRGLRRRKSIA